MKRDIVKIILAELCIYVQWSMQDAIDDSENVWALGYSAGMSAAAGRLISCMYVKRSPIHAFIEVQLGIQTGVRYELNKIIPGNPHRYGDAYAAGYTTVMENMIGYISVQLARYEVEGEKHE